MIRTLLGLDFGKTVGWCLLMMDEGKTIATVTVGDIQHDGEDRGEINLAYMTWVEKLLPVVDVVAYEEVRFNRGFSYIPFQMGYVQGRCVALQKPYVGVNVSELKAWARKGTKYGRNKEGSGMNKDDMILAAREMLSDTRHGINHPISADMADATLAALWARENALMEISQ